MVPEDVSFEFIREITDGLSEERIIGEGAFGVVYKGVTKNGHAVAVKLLKPCLADPDKQFRNEFRTLLKLNHQNIVKVLGYCYDTEKKFIMLDGSNKVLADEIHAALCFEYMHNGSLHNHLSDESCVLKLDWHKRFKIIKGICEALKYMHKDLEEPIYHLDLKPDNILLDKDMVPKIADFGLSKIFGHDITWITQNAYGTPGYQPPEYIDRNEISGKFDIFSLGAVMIRIVSGSMGHPESSNMSSYEYIDKVREIWRNKLQETCSSNSLLEAYCCQVETCAQIALQCLDKESHKRPDIVEITEQLNDIENGVDKLPEKGCVIIVSEMTVQNSIEMRKESKEITCQHQSTDLLSSSSCTQPEHTDARETPKDVEELIVGREEEKGEIIASLLESSSKNISILPIHGIGGIGKTTFSRLIYNDPKFKSYSKAWVHVSHRFDLKKIGESIISQLSKNENQANEIHVAHSSLKELLPGKNILIVLDDLWEDNQLQLMDLKDMLYNDDSKIIILVTTRSKSVAERICTNLQPYQILPLTNELCWDIIKQRSGFGARDDKEMLTGIGQQIAQKCAGVALAAQSLGFTLRGMNFDQWMELKDSNLWKVHVSKDISLPDPVLASLMLSYSYMDPCLKPCFTYCGVFPKGHQIVKNDLIYQWISLGFIEPTKLRSVMDLCKKYIMQLQGLSFLQESPKTSEAYNQEATIFTMHDLVHDLAISLLGNQIIDQCGQGNTRGSSCQYVLLADCSKALKLFLTSPASPIALRILDCCRTKLLFCPAFAPATSLKVLDLSESCIHKLAHYIGELKELRYLYAPGIQDLEFPESITRLSHLIYLNLHRSTIKVLPESIGEMKDLMHLDLSGCTQLNELPVSFWNLENLVHLNLSGCYGISGVSESIGRMSQLEHLNLSYCMINGDLARALGLLTELQYLNLSRSKCSGNLSLLVNLTKLRYLDIEYFLQYFEKAEVDTFLESISSLPSLEYLNLSDNYSIHSIPESFGKLSKLHTLDLSNCYHLRRLPDSISTIKSLKYLHVAGTISLDKSTLPQHKKALVLFPNFVVHAGVGGSSSNLCDLEYENPSSFLEISRLQNVKSADEAQRIKLVEKQSIEGLELKWTRYERRFVDDAEVLKQLMPPDTLKEFSLDGYESVSFPSWMMNIATYLPQLTDVTLYDLPRCNNLPPLGQLPNLVKLRIRSMDSIREIDGGLYGGIRAFPRLAWFELDNMRCLEEWNTAYSGDDGFNEVVFPNLWLLQITFCPKLRLKTSLPQGKRLSINQSDGVLLSSLGASSSAATNSIQIYDCEAPLHQWSLLRHVPCLEDLYIQGCSDLTCSSTDDLLGCLHSLERLTFDGSDSIVALPECLGDLTALKELKVRNCKAIKTLPDSIQQLTCLQSLEVNRCPDLVQWCISEENNMKLAHIKEIEIIDMREVKLVSDAESDSDLNSDLNSDGEDPESEQDYRDSGDEEPETEQDYMGSDDEEPESERNQFDQDSDHQESRVNSVRSLRKNKLLVGLVGDKDIPQENGGGTFNPGPFPRSLTPQALSLLNRVWKNKSLAPNKKVFIWRLVTNALSMGERPGRLSRHINRNCDYCGQMENYSHLFFHCDFARAVWYSANPPLKSSLLPFEQEGVQEAITLIINNSIPDNLMCRIISTLWFIWNARNDPRLKQKQMDYFTSTPLGSGRYQDC